MYFLFQILPCLRMVNVAVQQGKRERVGQKGFWIEGWRESRAV